MSITPDYPDCMSPDTSSHNDDVLSPTFGIDPNDVTEDSSVVDEESSFSPDVTISADGSVIIITPSSDPKDTHDRATTPKPTSGAVGGIGSVATPPPEPSSDLVIDEYSGLNFPVTVKCTCFSPDELYTTFPSSWSLPMLPKEPTTINEFEEATEYSLANANWLDADSKRLVSVVNIRQAWNAVEMYVNPPTGRYPAHIKHIIASSINADCEVLEAINRRKRLDYNILKRDVTNSAGLLL